MISRFENEYYFLSNFYTAPVTIDGITYQNNEAAFQSFKTSNKEDRKRFAHLSASEAKRLGRSVTLRPDWENIKYDVMYSVVKAKFTQNIYLAEKLRRTGDQVLVEGNWWHDTTWGRCNGEGKNWLGQILMSVREELNNGQNL